MTKKTAAKRSKRRSHAIEKLRPNEAAAILRALLARHPALATEATAMAEAMITRTSADDVADAVEEAILALDIDALGDRAGEHQGGYTEPGEAAWELLQEALDPFVDDLRRRIALGAEAAAIETCRGIVLGLYRIRGKNPDAVLGWAADFPLEAAAQTVSIYERRVEVRVAGRCRTSSTGRFRRGPRALRDGGASADDGRRRTEVERRA